MVKQPEPTPDPRLTLTAAQASRLWSFGVPQSEALLESLVRSGNALREGGLYVLSGGKDR